MRIVIDSAIPFGEAAFSQLGQLIAVPGRELERRHLLDTGAEVLITRSITRVNRALVQDTAVRLVVTATAGIDHIDTEALRSLDIAFASAAGCNAAAVARWVVAALAYARAHGPSTWQASEPIGIVGFGHVGSATAEALRSSGNEVWVCDPPRARAGHRDQTYYAFEDLCRHCAILSFHVPLIRQGQDRTLHLVDGEWQQRNMQCIINTSRGAVVSNAALSHMASGTAIIDVWEDEPALPWSLLGSDGPILLASPHVAGYGLDGKVMATRMAHEAVCRFLGHAPYWTGERILIEAPQHSVDLLGDDARVRALAQLPEEQRGPAFEALRRNYRLRHPMAETHVIDRT